MAKKASKKDETLNLEAILFKCRDILRQAKNSGSFFEKRDMMLTLVSSALWARNTRMEWLHFVNDSLRKG